MRLMLMTDEIRAILAAYLFAQGLPIEEDAKADFVVSDGDGESLKVEILTASFAIRETSEKEV